LVFDDAVLLGLVAETPTRAPIETRNALFGIPVETGTFVVTLQP